MATEKIGRIVMLEESMTQQSPKDECDINCIVERAKRGADISALAKPDPIYGDFTSIPEYREALQIVVDARNAFNGLDAFVRERFGNDPARMMDFLGDSANFDEAVRLGLVKPKDIPPPGDITPLPEAPSPARADSGSSGEKPVGGSDTRTVRR